MIKICQFFWLNTVLPGSNGELILFIFTFYREIRSPVKCVHGMSPVDPLAQECRVPHLLVPCLFSCLKV